MDGDKRQFLGRILLVEDHQDTAFTFERLLKSNGYHVLTVPTGEAALQQIEIQSFDLLISDIRLPGMDGWQLLAKARTIQPDLQAIALSALGMAQDVQKSQAAGYAKHITKPVPIDVVLEAIQAVCTQKPARRQSTLI